MGKADKSINDIGVLLEDMNGKFDFMLEIIKPMHKDLIELKSMYDEDIPTIKADIKVIKAAAKKTNQNVADLDERITRLEASTA